MHYTHYNKVTPSLYKPVKPVLKVLNESINVRQQDKMFFLQTTFSKTKKVTRKVLRTCTTASHSKAAWFQRVSFSPLLLNNLQCHVHTYSSKYATYQACSLQSPEQTVPTPTLKEDHLSVQFNPFHTKSNALLVRVATQGHLFHARLNTWHAAMMKIVKKDQVL